jgi:hypothetical protein
MSYVLPHGLSEDSAIGVPLTPARLSTTVTLVVKLKELQLTDVPMHMDSMGTSQLRRFEHFGDLSDLENAISNQQKAVDLTNDGHPDQPMYFSNLGISQLTRFEHLGDLSDFKNAILNKQQAVDLTDDRHPDKPMYLSNLGIFQQTRFDYLGNLSDLENAISNKQKAVDFTDDGHRDQPMYFSSLGNSQQTRFNHLGDSSDLENAILNKQKAVDLTVDGHPDQPIYFSNLGICQRTLFEHFGDLSDLENAISNIQKAVDLTGDAHRDQPIYLSNLGNSQQTRFERLGHLFDLENSISNIQKAVDLTDDGHPDQPMYFLNLGMSQQTRFDRLGDFSDLENAISNKQKAVDLTDGGHPDQPIYFSNLGISKQARFDRFGDLADLENAISNIQKAVEITDDRYLGKARGLSNLGISQRMRFERLGDLSDLENAISNIQKAVDLTDDGHPSQPMYSSNLGNTQRTRFERLGHMFDLENAISNIQKAVDLTDDGHPDQPVYSSNLGNSQQTRFERLGHKFDLENAISNIQKAVDLTDDGHPDQPIYFSNLGNSQRTRFRHLGDLSDLENSISNLQKAVELTDARNVEKAGQLHSLSLSQRTRFEHLGDLSNLEDAISNVQKAIELTGDGHPAQPRHFSTLGISQQTRFVHHGDLSDLENAISNQQKAVDFTDDENPMKGNFLLGLGISLQTRFLYFGDPDDFVVSVSSYKAAAHLKLAYPSVALHAARQWAQTSHHNDDLLSALDGYRTALELFSKVAWLGLDTTTRQDMLLQEKAENLGCLAATCAIRLGHLEEAVELLDLGRSVFWKQASSLRSDFETLRQQDTEVAEKLEGIGRQLDAGNFYLTGERKFEDDRRNMEEIGRERRRLVSEWEELVVRVRQLPQFEFFLKPIPFSQLRQSCMTGQVVIINTSAYGVDALVFGATGLIEHVSLPDINHDALTELSQNIVLNQPSRGSELQRRKYTTHFLKPTLRTIWNDVLIHIFDKIHISLEDKIPMLPQHRIWWYLTGPLTFIPVHAAGPGLAGAPDVSQLIISSYVTTLESLFRAQKKYVPVLKERQKFLCVSQPETPGQTPLPQTAEEANDIIKILHSVGWSEENIACLSGTEATVDAVSAALNSCSWVHLACHGFQDPNLGMKSAFALHDGHLELGEIASKRLSIGQLALLSACQAASGLKDLPGEAMHLAAGLQFAGFPSVIATLWTIRDDDAAKVTSQVYRFLLRNGTKGLEPSDAALALNHAILYLREDTSVTVDRWAPFVHFGI